MLGCFEESRVEMDKGGCGLSKGTGMRGFGRYDRMVLEIKDCGSALHEYAKNANQRNTNAVICYRDF